MQAAPPPVLFQKGEAETFFSQFPFVVDGKTKSFIIGLRLSSKHRPLLENVRVKLLAEGWPVSIERDPAGKPFILVGTEHRKLQQVVVLSQRFEAKEFGAVDAAPVAIPDPSIAR